MRVSDIREHPSPNRNARPAGARPELLVLHYTGMPTAQAALERLCDPAAEVSAHYLVDEDGTTVALVPEELRAWHAGQSWWRGRAGLNDVSVGIELVNPGHEWGYRPFPPAQTGALVALARGVMDRWSIPAWGVVAHSDIAPDRKEDPGELLDWRGLAAEGVGVWPEPGGEIPPDEADARTMLAKIGYPLEPQGVTIGQALTAFQRRFRPQLVDGGLDPGTMGRLRDVAGLLGRLHATT